MNDQISNSEKKGLKFYYPVILAAVLILGMYLGDQISHRNASKGNIMAFESRLKVNQVLEYIDKKYVDSVNKTVLIKSAIQGILKNLDPHSVYISPTNLQQASEFLQGNFEGIGIRFFIVNDTIMVVSPIAGGPSAALGILPGDKIIEIESENVAGIGISEQDVVNMLRGEKGSAVNISILRANTRAILAFDIIRDKIPLYSVDVSYMVDENIGYIKISHFSRTTNTEFTKAINILKSQGLQKMILDLRGNPGGFLNAAIVLADEFINEGKLLLYTEGRRQEKEEYRASKGGKFEQGDLVILIDRGSASASEIVAGAIQDWDRGVIIGRRSFGKGLVQEQHQFEDGSAIRLTIARYYTPIGRCIQKPYDNGFEDYYFESYERFSSGELGSADSIEFADSLKFITPAGKVVYGGGGIMPDIFVPLDTSRNSVYLNKLMRKGLVMQFAYDHVSNHKTDFNSYKNVAEFIEHYDAGKELVPRLIKYAEQKDVPFNQADFDKSEEQIEILLCSYVAQQLWRNEGFYQVRNQLDEVFQKALEVLNSEESVESELSLNQAK
ncbi:MAG: PDZ domain-containing protein [Bacteroidetes bacterium]|nr:PDZ domain-containing protein [Bacteroidota bacterium]